MASVEDHAQLASDAELITRVRAGDRSAFGDLYSRHAAAAASLARQFSRSGAEADDLVSEAFARVLDGMLAGKGPDTAFRAYLFTTLRNTAYDRTRKDKRLQFTDDIESHDVAVEGDDPVMADLEAGLVGKAFASLPERWQTVLWHTQVEGQSAAEVGVLLGMAPNAVTSLAFRAREGLREAYLQAHLAETADDACHTTVDRLGAWARGGLSKREKAQVDAHLETCERCRALAAELGEINSSLRGLLAPLLLGGAAIGYISTLGPVVPLAQLGVLSGGSAAAVGGKATGGHALAGLTKPGSWSPGAVLAGVAAVAAVAVAGFVIALSGHHSSPATASNGPPVSAATGANGNGGGGAGGGAAGPGGGAGAGAGGAGNGAGAGAGTGAGAGGTGAGAGAGSGAGGSGAGSGTGAGGAAGNGGNGTTGGNGANGSGAAGGGNGSGVPGGDIFATPTPNTAGPTAAATDTAGQATNQGQPSDGTSSTSEPGNAGQSTSETNQAPPTAPTTSAPATSQPTTSQAPTTPITTPLPTTPVTTPPTTQPPTAPNVGVGAGSSVSAGLTAGGSGSLTLKLTNSGGTASPAGASVEINAPAGFTLSPPVLGLGLRGAFTALAASAPATCTATDATASCTLPAIAAGATLSLTVPLTTDPTAQASGEIAVIVNGKAGTPIPVSVASGYASATVSSADLVRGATNRVHLVAKPAPAVANPGSLSLPTALAPGMTIVGLAPSQVVGSDAVAADPTCAISVGVLTCPSDQAVAGVDLAVQVAANAVAGPTAPASDQGQRTLDTGSLTVSTATDGGYRSVTLDGPDGPLRPGSTITINLRGNPDGSVLVPSPIAIPVQLSPGLTVVDVPDGCKLGTTTLICSPTDAKSLIFPLTVAVDPDAGAEQPLGTVTVGSGGEIQLTPTGDVPITVDPTLGGYTSITLDPGPLVPGKPTTLTITGNPAPGFTNPGPITLPNDLGSGVTIVGVISGNCEVAKATTVCTPTPGTDPTTWVLNISVADEPEPGTLAPVVTLPGDRTLTTTAAPGVDLTVRGAQTPACPTNNVMALANGDFEAPVGQPGAPDFVENSDTTVWQSTALDPDVKSDHLIEFWQNGGNVQSANNGTPIAAQSGIQWVELNANQRTALYQDVPTPVGGETMRWTIWHRARATAVPNGQDVMQVQIGAPDSDLSAEQSGPDISDGPAEWVKHTGTYKVPEGQTVTRFQFAAVSSSSGDPTYGNFLDNISFATEPCLNSTTAVAAVNKTTNPGDVLRYSTTVTNVGGDPATGVTLADQLPTNVTYVPGSLTIDRTKSPDPDVSKGTITVGLGPPDGPDGAHALEPGVPTTVTFDVTINQNVPVGDSISNNAVINYLWSGHAEPQTVSNTVFSTVSEPGPGS